jgi:hypothetical protein
VEADEVLPGVVLGVDDLLARCLEAVLVADADGKGGDVPLAALAGPHG